MLKPSNAFVTGVRKIFNCQPTDSSPTATKLMSKTWNFISNYCGKKPTFFSKLPASMPSHRLFPLENLKKLLPSVSTRPEEIASDT